MKDHDKAMILDLLQKWLTSGLADDKNDLLNTIEMISRKNGHKLDLGLTLNTIETKKGKIGVKPEASGMKLNRARPQSANISSSPFLAPSSGLKSAQHPTLTSQGFKTIKGTKGGEIAQGFKGQYGNYGTDLEVFNHKCYPGELYPSHEFPSEHSHQIKKVNILSDPNKNVGNITCATDLEVRKICSLHGQKIEMCQKAEKDRQERIRSKRHRRERQVYVTTQEKQLWERDEILNCHYKGVFKEQNLEGYAAQAYSKLQLSKQEKLRKEIESKDKRAKSAEYIRKVTTMNRLMLKKNEEIKDQGAEDKTKTPWWSDERRINKQPVVFKKEKSEGKKGRKYLPERVPLSTYLGLQGEQISKYYLKEYKKRQLELKEKDQENKGKEKKTYRYEVDSAKIKYSKQGEEHLKQILKEKREKKEARRKLREKVLSLDKEAKEKLRKVKKAKLEIDDNYVFRTDMDKWKKEADQLKADELQHQRQESQNRKNLQIQQEYLKALPKNKDRPRSASGVR